ncbi:hypothetical protein ACTQ6A_16585, partial [Lachnospiraceae bacterium LCP25S3_G4]
RLTDIVMMNTSSLNCLISAGRLMSEILYPTKFVIEPKFLARNIFFPPVELKDKLQSIIEDNLNITNMKNYYEIYDVLKKDKKIKNEITIDRFISTFDMCIIRYFIGKIGLNYYKEQESIESLFNSYWEDVQS